MGDTYKLSVVLPAYNEEGNIGEFIAEISEVLQEQGIEFEFIVVESGSTDATAAIVQDLSQKDPRIRLIRQLDREGLGSAIRLGLSNAKYDLIFYTDGDRAIDARDILQVLALKDEGDIVIGYRLNRSDSKKRMLYTKVYNAVIRSFFGLEVNDVNFSCKLIRRKILPHLHLKANGAFFDAEFLAEVKRHQYTIKELGVVYLPRQAGVSTLGRPAVILEIFVEMFNYALFRIFSSRK